MREKLDFGKQNGLIPAIIQDDKTNKVLMLGFMDTEALSVTLETGKVTFHSRTKNRLWTKGESSGNHLMVKSILPDCDNDTLLIKASPLGPVCHTGNDTCFNEENKNPFSFKDLEEIILDRKENPQEAPTPTTCLRQVWTRSPKK